MTFDDLSDGALLLVDSPPVIYVLDGHPTLGQRFRPLFEAQARERLRFAVTTITIAEVLPAPSHAAKRCRAVLERWRDAVIAKTAARLRATLRLKLSDAIQAASAFAIDADARS